MRAVLVALVLACALSGALAAPKTSRQRLSDLMRRRAELQYSLLEEQDAFLQSPADAVCITWGDTHIIPFGGQWRYDIHNTNPYLMTRFDNGDRRFRFEVHANQRYGWWGGATTDNDIGIRCGFDVIVYRQPRNGARASVEVNGRAVNIDGQFRELLPSAPNGRNLYTLRDISPNSAWDIYELRCNPDEDSSAYASGFRLLVSWYRSGDTRGIYGNTRLEAADRYRWRLAGACGWQSNGAHPYYNNWIMDESQSLLGLKPADHAREAKEGRKSVEPKEIEKQKGQCKGYIKEGTGIDVDNLHPRLVALDKDVKKTLDDYISGCAIDLYYGAEHSSKEMSEQVCDWVKSVKTQLNKEMEEMADKIETCKRPFTPPAKYAPLLKEKFELDQFCNRSPPKNEYSMPAFTDCQKKEEEENGKKQAEQEAKTREQQNKEENVKVLKKAEEHTKQREADAKASAVQEQQNKVAERKALHEKLENDKAKEADDKRAREAEHKRRDKERAEQHERDEKQEEKEKHKNPNGDFMNQKTSIIMLK